MQVFCLDIFAVMALRRSDKKGAVLINKKRTDEKMKRAKSLSSAQHFCHSDGNLEAFAKLRFLAPAAKAELLH